jgi:ribonuclease-3
VDDPLEPAADAGSLTAPVKAEKATKPELGDLEARLGHSFANALLVEQALTHPSASLAGGAPSYERLEFLGDRVLGLAVSEMLCEAYPGAPEGALAVRLNRLVRGETCAEVAQVWNVGPHLRLGVGEARNGGRKKIAILGDACEALIGAVFLDAGFPAARALVRRFWEARMRADAAPIQDAKTAAQEWAAARGLPLPSYVIVERSGPDHMPLFVMQIEIDGFAPERGEATSKRAAEQAAARAFLDARATP